VACPVLRAIAAPNGMLNWASTGEFTMRLRAGGSEMSDAPALITPTSIDSTCSIVRPGSSS